MKRNLFESGALNQRVTPFEPVVEQHNQVLLEGADKPKNRMQLLAEASEYIAGNGQQRQYPKPKLSRMISRSQSLELNHSQAMNSHTLSRSSCGCFMMVLKWWRIATVKPARDQQYSRVRDTTNRSAVQILHHPVINPFSFHRCR